MTVSSVAGVFTSALRGQACLAWDDEEVALLPTSLWLGTADTDDAALLALCLGPTVDIGCGPGRLTEALAGQGRVVLGIDVVPEAVRQSLHRGGATLLRDVFGPVPGEGRWGTALLADGNIGIGGDPIALLERTRELIAPHGRVVVELAPPGRGIVTRHVRLETQVGCSDAFPWTVVGVDAISAVARSSGLACVSQHRIGRRWCAVLESAP